MKIFDAHVHVDARGFEDLRTIALYGTSEVTTFAHDALPFSCAGSVLDHFERLLTLDSYRLRKCGITPHVGLGVHPRGIPGVGFDQVLDSMPALLRRSGVVAVGEIGLHTGSEVEIDVFGRQLGLAKSLGMPAVVHTPEKNKLDVTRRIISVIEDVGIDLNQIIIDHASEETFSLVRMFGCWVGVSVHPSKLSEERGASLIKQFGSERVILNSDFASAFSDILALPKTVLEMRSLGVPEAEIVAAVHDNAARFYGLYPAGAK